MTEQDSDKRVEVVIANAIALDPAKKYLIVMDAAAVSREDVARLLDGLHDQGIEAATALLTDGDPFTAVQVIEVN
jgi:hypothetical protein